MRANIKLLVILSACGVGPSRLDCPLLKGKKASHPKFERHNGKILRSNFFYLRQELVRPAHFKTQ